MAAKNAVIAGDYDKKKIIKTAKGLVIVLGFIKQIAINKDNVESWEVMDEQSKTSATSAIGRGLVGSFLLGPVGILAGLSAKKKGTHIVAVQFKDGAKSLLEIDDKMHKTLMTSLF